MDNLARFAFRISAYTPDTIPLERLARYMSAIAALMGNENHVHFSFRRIRANGRPRGRLGALDSSLRGNDGATVLA